MKNDSPHATRLAQRAPLDLLREFLVRENEALCNGIPWHREAKEVRAALQMAILNLPRTDRCAIDELCERIDRMTDEAGVEAINYTHDEIIDIEAFEKLGDQYARSLWLYLRERDNFYRAEDTRYADEYRGTGRIYSAFKGPKKIDIELTEERKGSLLKALAEFFRTPDPVLLDHFVRPRFDLESDEDIELHQFGIQHNGDRQSVETIQQDGDIGLIHFCPANSVKITYEPDDGIVEVFARDRNIRPEIFKLFVRHVLDRDLEVEAVPLQNYALGSLASERDFPIVDPDIASVRATQLRLRVGAKRSWTGLKLGDGEDRTIYQLARDLYGPNNPLEQAHHIDRAWIVIRFHKQPGQRRARSLPIVITTPNGCNVKSHCDKDRQLAQKYLRLWKLIVADVGDDAGPRGA